MIFDCRFSTAGHDDDLVAARRQRFFHAVLDHRLIDQRQHFLGNRFGGRQKAGAEARGRKNGLAHFCLMGHCGFLEFLPRLNQRLSEREILQGDGNKMRSLLRVLANRYRRGMQPPSFGWPLARNYTVIMSRVMDRSTRCAGAQKRCFPVASILPSVLSMPSAARRRLSCAAKALICGTRMATAISIFLVPGVPMLSRPRISARCRSDSKSRRAQCQLRRFYRIGSRSRRARHRCRSVY